MSDTFKEHGLFIEKIVRGGARIDQMKDELDFIVRKTLAIVSVMPTSSGVLPEQFKLLGIESYNRSYWEMNRTHDELQIRCIRTDSRSGPKVAYTTDSSWKGVPFMRLGEGIMFAHNALPVFMRGMFHHFPDLKQYLQPYLDAADGVVEFELAD